MKPFNIFLVRHGESVGNVDKNVYMHTPDWKVSLTPRGHDQAEQAAKKIVCLCLRESKKYFILSQPRPLAVTYCSPWKRTRDTAEPIMAGLKLFDEQSKYLEDPRLREQEWGNFQEKDFLAKQARERDRYGTFFYRIQNGESGADVFDRISTFFETLYRDFKKVDYPLNTIIVSHGLTIRCFLMRWFHWSVEDYERLRNPKNGSIIRMQLNLHTDKYDLMTKMQKYDFRNSHIKSSVI